MKMIHLAALLLSIALTSCQPDSKSDPTGPIPATNAVTVEQLEAPSPASLLLAKTITAHGGDLYASAHYGFTFRSKAYTFKNHGQDFTYTASTEKDGQRIIDTLTNGRFVRTINGEAATLTQKEVNSYTEALNSVIYFATLPHKLLDPAVNLEKRDDVTIKDQAYEVLKVHFDEEGGGTDHDDNFMYWINQSTGRIDYLAYDYRTNGGGVRFRSAYNPRVVDGVLFQDYVNYKAALGTALADLPTLYEQGKLEELSKIQTENVVKL